MQSKRILGVIILLVTVAGFLLVSVKWEESYLWLSFAMVGMSLLMFLIRFEKRKVEPRELVLIAVLAAIAAVGRIPFASIPSVQPTTFIIMMSGFVFGAESGFLIGAVAALASNMILGQGPWTPWQMLAWGLVGLTAGLLRKTPVMNNKYGRILFGIVWGFLFGLIMNVWGLLGFIQSGVPLDEKTFITYFGASALFDSMHAVSNVFFLIVFSGTWLKILTRFKSKYGLLER